MKFPFLPTAIAVLLSHHHSSLLLPFASAKQVTLSNTQLPLDQNGNKLLTGETSVLALNGTYYFYMNNWGGCPGLDCCSSGACATCCFSPPSARFNDTCVYTTNHSVVVYSTTDFDSYEYLGVALPLSARISGIEFRPQVLYNPTSNLFIMWYEDRWNGQHGYAVATSSTPQGPFVTIQNSTDLSGNGRVGDYDIFIDDDGSAYHVRTGITIVKLDSTWMAGTSTVVEIPNGGVEGPAMFKRNNIYYILVGVGCCACRGGSNILVYTSTTGPLGPYTESGDVGSNTSQPFHASSPLNYATHAQQTKVIPVPDESGNVQYLWLGNQWVTSVRSDGRSIGGPRNQDLLYWTVLGFNSSGAIQQVEWSDTTTITV